MKEERVHEFLVTECLGTELADKKSNQKGIKEVKRGHWHLNIEQWTSGEKSGLQLTKPGIS